MNPFSNDLKQNHNFYQHSHASESALDSKGLLSESRLDRLENLVFNLLNTREDKEEKSVKKDFSVQTAFPCSNCGCNNNNNDDDINSHEDTLNSISEVTKISNNYSVLFTAPPITDHISSPVILNFKDSNKSFNSLSTELFKNDKRQSDDFDLNTESLNSSIFSSKITTSKDKEPQMKNERYQPEGSHILDDPPSFNNNNHCKQTVTPKNPSSSSDEESDITYQHLQYNTLLFNTQSKIELDTSLNPYAHYNYNTSTHPNNAQDSIYFKDLAKKYLKDMQTSKVFYDNEGKVKMNHLGDYKPKRQSSTPIRKPDSNRDHPPSFLVSAVEPPIKVSNEKVDLFGKNLRILDGFKRKPPLPNICNLSDEANSDERTSSSYSWNSKTNSWNNDKLNIIESSSLNGEGSVLHHDYKREINFSAIKNLPNI